jgi:POT family proton-dependent oligopeptide transporter
MVMTKAFGFVDVASMNSLDACSVLFFGYLTSSYIYPALASRGIKLPTTYKFAIGSGLGALAIVWALFVEHKIHRAYQADGSQLCVLWQAPAYILIGWGEIFAVSAAYEVAFTASSPDKKVLASATNIFCVGGLPNLICIILYHSCSSWFTNSRGTTNIQYIEDYATAQIGKYFMVLLGVMLLGVVINTIPQVRDFVSSVEEKAADIIRTPGVQKYPPKRSTTGDEKSPLLASPGTMSYQKKYGGGPVLYKMGSMRAGPSLSQSDLPGSKPKKVKYKYVPKLYNTEPLVARGPDGKPVKAGLLVQSNPKDIGRLNST